MYKLNPFRAPPLLGLEITPKGAALVQLQKTRRGFHLLHATTIPLPPELFNDETAITGFDELSTLITDQVNRLGLRGSPAAICMPQRQVRIEKYWLSPELSDEEMAADIEVILQQATLPFQESFSFDFTRMQSKDRLALKQEVFVVAIKTRYLSAIIDCIERAGLKVKIVEVDTFARERAQGAPEMAPDLLAAYGAAMREVPAW